MWFKLVWWFLICVTFLCSTNASINLLNYYTSWDYTSKFVGLYEPRENEKKTYSKDVPNRVSLFGGIFENPFSRFLRKTDIKTTCPIILHIDWYDTFLALVHLNETSIFHSCHVSNCIANLFAEQKGFENVWKFFSFLYHVRTQSGRWNKIEVYLLFSLTFNKEPNLIYIHKNDRLFGVYCCRNMQENETNLSSYS